MHHSTGSAFAVTTMMATVVAMAVVMVPSAVPVARHVARNSLARRRLRAVTEFVSAYLLIWTAFGVLTVLALATVPSVDPRLALVALLLAAAVWQIVPVHRRALRGCHRTVPLPARGWRAEAAAFGFGARNGAWCVGSCWCLMLVMCVAPGPTLVWGSAIGAGVFVEKTATRPWRVARVFAVVLALVALFVALR